MDTHPKWRLRARAALETYFHNRSFPRLTLGLLVSVAGLAGFFISHELLRFGVEEMWLRYPLAVIGGYAVFLILLRIWVEIERAHYQPHEVIISSVAPEEKEAISVLDKYQRGQHSWLDWLDVVELPIGDEGCLIGCFLIAVIGLLGSAIVSVVTFVMAGPEFLAEVFLDAVVVSMFYRRLKTAAKEHWLGTAVKRTGFSVLLTAIGLSLLGAGLGVMAPHSHSLGAALREIFSTPGSR